MSERAGDDRRTVIPGDAYTDARLLPDETDPATGESADDALERTRTVPEYLMPVEDASSRTVAWSVSPTQDSTQEAEWETPERAEAEGVSEFGVDRIVDATYFTDEADDLNDDEAAALQRLALPDAPHPGTQEPDLRDPDVLPTTDDTTRGGASRR